MAKSRHYSLFLKVFLLYQIVCGITGIKIDITRQQDGDFFTNPYAPSCQATHVDGSFCRIANSSCYSDRPKVGDKCCLCHCDILESTFDLRNLRCALNKDIRKGCSLRLNRKNDDEFLTAIDLDVDGLEEIKLPQLSHGSDLHQCTETKVEHMTKNGYVGVFRFFEIVTNKKTFSIKWYGSPNQKWIHGGVYRISVQCQIKGKRGKDKWSTVNDCFMIKSSGTFEIDHPGLPSASVSSSLLTSSLHTSSLQVQTSSLLISSPSATFSAAAVVSSSRHLIQPTSIVSKIRQPFSSTSELRQSSYSSSFDASDLTSCLTSEYNILASERTLFSTTTGHLSSYANIEQERTTQKTSTPAVMEKSVKRNPDRSRQTVTSTVVNEEQKNVSGSEKTGRNGTIVVYLSVTIAVLVVIILVAVVLWYVVSFKRRAKEKPGRSSRTVYSGSTKNEPINGEAFAMRSMKNDEILYEGIYELTVSEPSIKRTVSGGIENARFDDVNENNVGLYTALDECKDKTSNYQALILPIEANSTTSRDVCNLSVPTYDKQQQITSDPVYQSLEEPLTYLDILSDDQMSNQDSHVYSTLEEYQQAEESQLTEDDYLVVVPNKTVNKTSCDLPVYADLMPQREQNEYQGLVTRKL